MEFFKLKSLLGGEYSTILIRRSRY